MVKNEKRMEEKKLNPRIGSDSFNMGEELWTLVNTAEEYVRKT